MSARSPRRGGRPKPRSFDDQLGAAAWRHGPEALEGSGDGGGIRAVARLVDSGLPATGEPFPDSFPERLGEVLVQERTENELVGVGDDRVARRSVPPRFGRESRRDTSLDRFDGGQPIRRQEAGDRRNECDRR